MISVLKNKQSFMENPDRSIQDCFSNAVPLIFTELLQYLKSLQIDSKLDYNRIRFIFQKKIQELGKSIDGKLEFMLLKRAAKNRLRKCETESASQAKSIQKPVKNSASSSK